MKHLSKPAFLKQILECNNNSSLHGLITKFKFSNSQSTSEKKSKKQKYSDQYELSKEEIDSVLIKVEKKPEILYKHEFKFQHNYEKDIKSQLEEISKNNKNNFGLQSQTITPMFEKDDKGEQFLTEEKAGEVQQRQNEISTQTKNDSEIEVKYYKYGLPIPNLPPKLTPLPDPFAPSEEEQITINERVFEVLRLNENTSYQQFELAARNEFNSEVDMYGDALNHEQNLTMQREQYGELACVPRDVLKNDKYMDQVRRCLTLNLNMPGVMENEHPHKFLKELRPVEEFRHTPIIPISDRQMKEFDERVKAYHRRGFYFEVKRETVYNYTFLGCCFAMAIYLMKKAIDREEETGVSVERLKITRMQNQVV